MKYWYEVYNNYWGVWVRVTDIVSIENANVQLAEYADGDDVTAHLRCALTDCPSQSNTLDEVGAWEKGMVAWETKLEDATSAFFATGSVAFANSILYAR